MGALRERETTCASLKPAWKSLRFHHVGMAFFWACSMLTFRSSILLSGALDNPLLASIVTLISFTTNMTALFAFASLAERNPLFFQRIPLRAVAAATVLGLALLYVAGETPGPAPFVIMVIGSALTGACYGFMWGGWAECYGRMNPCHTVIYLPLCFVVTAALFSAIGLAVQYTPIPSLALMVPLPCISLWCLARCRSQHPIPAAVRKTGQNRSLKALESLVGLIVASLILSCLFGFIWEMAVLSVKSVTNAHQVPLAFNLVVALALLGFVSIAQRRTDLALAFQVLIPLLVVFFAVVPFVWHDNPILLNSIMSACYGVFDVIIWYSVATAAYDFAISGFIVGGIVRALSILSRLIGMGLGYIVMLIPDESPASLVAISAGALYALLMLLFFYFWNTRRRKKEQLAKREADALLQGGGELDDSGEGMPAESASPVDAGGVGRASAAGGDGATGGANSAEAPAAAKGAHPACAHTGRTCPHAAGVSQAAELTSGNAPETAVKEASSQELQLAALAGGPSPAGPSPAGGATDPDPAEEEGLFELLARDYGLTRREAEVLPYLARGRSARVIADALFVSESTIRTHTRRILEKTDLHSKQQLIDLIDHYLRA